MKLQKYDRITVKDRDEIFCVWNPEISYGEGPPVACDAILEGGSLEDLWHVPYYSISSIIEAKLQETT